MDCSPLGSFVHGIFQARILEWVAMPSSRGSSQPRDQTQVSCIAGRFLTVWATREVPWKKSYDKSRQHIKKRKQYFANKDPYSQSYGFSSDHVWMWELDHKEDWIPTNWCFWTVVLEKTLESPLDCKEIKPVNPKRNQSWIFIERTHAKAEPPILCHLMRRTDSFEKDPDAGKD